MKAKVFMLQKMYNILRRKKKKKVHLRVVNEVPVFKHFVLETLSLIESARQRLVCVCVCEQ